ncbi:hypothetical protein [Thiolapillus sp.]|uniref:hypothetical protein n=1 Tax=Thiolapillus sp. TaxID=2017437 RepID=UPI0025E0AAE9|nr:hypothetical protein [Thiolapillus sp.]
MKQALINHLKANAELIEALSKHLLLGEAAKVTPAPAPAPAAPVPPMPAAPVPPTPAAPVPPTPAAPVPPTPAAPVPLTPAAPVPPTPAAPAPAVIDAAAIVAKLHQLTTNRADDGALAFALLADYKVKRVSDIPKESFPEFAGIIDWYIANPDQQHTAVGGVA